MAAEPDDQYPLSANEWPVGFEADPLEFKVTPELNQQNLFAQEDFDPRYIEGGPTGQGIVHPSLLLNMSNTTRSPSYRLHAGIGGLHAREETTFLKSPAVGDIFTVNWTVVERYTKRDRPYAVVEVVVTNGDGEPVMKRLAHETYTFGN